MCERVGSVVGCFRIVYKMENVIKSGIVFGRCKIVSEMKDLFKSIVLQNGIVFVFGCCRIVSKMEDVFENLARLYVKV